MISQHNASVLKSFEKERRVNGIGTRTLKNDMQALRKPAEFLDKKPFEQATRRNLIDFFDPQRLCLIEDINVGLLDEACAFQRPHGQRS